MADVTIPRCGRLASYTDTWASRLGSSMTTYDRGVFTDLAIDSATHIDSYSGALTDASMAAAARHCVRSVVMQARDLRLLLEIACSRQGIGDMGSAMWGSRRGSQMTWVPLESKMTCFSPIKHERNEAGDQK